MTQDWLFLTKYCPNLLNPVWPRHPLLLSSSTSTCSLPSPNTCTWLPGDRIILVDPGKCVSHFHLLSGSHQYLLSLQPRGLWCSEDMEMKSKGGDIWIGSCRGEASLLTSSLKDVFARLWALEDRGYVTVCSKLVIYTYLAHRLASTDVCWMNKSGWRAKLELYS